MEVGVTATKITLVLIFVPALTIGLLIGEKCGIKNPIKILNKKETEVEAFKNPENCVYTDNPEAVMSLQGAKPGMKKNPLDVHVRTIIFPFSLSSLGQLLTVGNM